MMLNSAGIALIKEMEGCRLLAYQDSAGIWTIGYGQTGPTIKEGLRWTQAKADWAFAATTAKISRQLNILLQNPSNKFPSVNDNQFSAMIDFAYNLGFEDLEHILKEVGIEGFPEKIQEYVHGGGKILSGLILRRQREKELFNAPNI